MKLTLLYGLSAQDLAAPHATSGVEPFPHFYYRRTKSRNDVVISLKCEIVFIFAFLDKTSAVNGPNRNFRTHMYI